jgi:hypothetical protein
LSMRPMSKNLRVLAKSLALWATLGLPVGLSAGSEWKVETVDQSGPGRYTSMKIDPKGNVHVAYIPEVEGHPLKYAYWDHALDRWFSMTVAQNASFCTLVLDSKQRPHISYADHGRGKGAKLRYIYWEGGADWKKQAVSPSNDAAVGYYTSIVLDAHDTASFSYYDYEGPAGIGFLLRLRSVFWNGKYWEVHMVDRQPGSGKFNSMAIDSKGHPHIAYANVKSEFMSLRYAKWDGDTWKSEVLEGMKEPTGMWSVALILDNKDNPHIAYTDVSHRLVKYAARKNGQWQLEVVDTIRKEAYPDRNGIALDSQGNPYISYYDAGEGTLKIATRKNGKWYGEILARDYAGFTSSLQIHDGTLWVAFADDGGGALKVARRPLDGPLTSPAVPQAPATKVSAK